MIIGHRGASALAPENTLAAFQLAMDTGAEGVEFDVRLARDGVPVVFHDKTLKRIADLSSFVNTLTSTELSKIDVGSRFGASEAKNGRSLFDGESIPSLKQTLELLEGFHGLVFIELKCDERDQDELTARVCEVVRSSAVMPRVIIKSFDLSVVTRAKIYLPDVRTAALFAPKMMTILRKEKHLVKIAVELGADELSIHYSLATRKLMEKAEKRGLPVNVWTVNNPGWLRRAFNLGIRSVITDDPAKFLAIRRELQEKPGSV
ncbi:MAG: glycerophosphodiester phosphodiesterase [Pyrinomonadaceae bacterium]